MSYIDWEMAEHPECYKRLYCNQVIDDAPPGRYPLVCQSTREIELPKEGE